jgi:hypothetical protein
VSRQPDLDSITQALNNAEDAQGVARTLKRRARFVVEQLTQDARTPVLLGLWGQCQNYDELAHDLIVPPAVLGELTKLAGLDSLPDNLVHAGIQHTYGYLFSSLVTAYGLKRDRWTSSVVEDGFGHQTPVLKPKPKIGTLLANATYFAGRIAFRSRTREMAMLRRLRDYVSPQLVEFPYRSMSIVRSVDQVSLSSSIHINLQTDFVKFSHGEKHDRRWLLVYSLQDSRHQSSQLISAFPVSHEVVEETLVESDSSQTATIRPRFNAWVDGLTGPKISGIRSTWEL